MAGLPLTKSSQNASWSIFQVLGCCKMGCWTTIKSFHVKIILLDKQELIQEIQVCKSAVSDVMTHKISNLYVEKKSAIPRLPERLNMLIVILMRHTDTITHTLSSGSDSDTEMQSLNWIKGIIRLQFAFLLFYEFKIKERERKIFTHFCSVHNFKRL